MVTKQKNVKTFHMHDTNQRRVKFLFFIWCLLPIVYFGEMKIIKTIIVWRQ